MRGQVAHLSGPRLIFPFQAKPNCTNLWAVLRKKKNPGLYSFKVHQFTRGSRPKSEIDMCKSKKFRTGQNWTPVMHFHREKKKVF